MDFEFSGISLMTFAILAGVAMFARWNAQVTHAQWEETRKKRAALAASRVAAE